ncbi:MAG TPA: hypothetical protein VJ732_17145, partial [Bryobacteraceae bacterium]|nr:hypothetical protein [Bryobacteraceae bacterium]
MRIHLVTALAFPLATLALAAEAPPPNGFQVRSYTGKCLDYGAPWPGSGATVYLNDCSAAHAIVVQEINNRHEVILHAGSQVIGIRAPRVFTTGSPPATPPALYQLELQPYHSFLASTANQAFMLDGDSIILASSRPCINSKILPATDNPNAYRTADVDPPAACPPAPPELVVQPQNGRGANGTPLVVAARNLAEPEFWDFKATDNTGRYPTSGFVEVASAAQLWDQVCADPQVPDSAGASFAPAGPCKEFAAGWGTVIVVKGGQQQGCVLQSESGATNIGPC